MLEARIIKPARSPLAFPVVIACKKDGHPRYCLDHRALNKLTNVDKFPIPNMEENLEGMASASVLRKLDMLASYWQVKLAEHVQEITTFTFKYSTFQFSVMIFGLMNTPAMFQRMATELLDDLDFVKNLY